MHWFHVASNSLGQKQSDSINPTREFKTYAAGSISTKATVFNQNVAGTVHVSPRPILTFFLE